MTYNTKAKMSTKIKILRDTYQAAAKAYADDAEQYDSDYFRGCVDMAVDIACDLDELLKILQ